MGKFELNKMSLRRVVLAAGLISPMIFVTAAAAPSGEALVNAKCSSCHAAKVGGGWDRISDARRTPEGWDMTVARMTYAHGVKNSVKFSGDERAQIVKFLADTQGLSPEESAAHRYIVERTPSVVEHPENKLIGDTCARCHSYGRIAVQRRTEADWRKLVHFHVGQYPAIEIQAGGRDRNWFEIASGDVAVELGKTYGYESDSWTNWKAQKPVDPVGEWRVVGHLPGVGDYEGNAKFERIGDDRYSVSMNLRYDNGTTESASGSAVVFTGHEWRATLKQGNRDVNHVMSFTSGGNELKGRWFEANNDSIGGTMRAVRSGKAANPTVMSVQPAMLRAGERAQLKINGVALSGEVALGAGVKIHRIVDRSSDRYVIEVEASTNLSSGLSEVIVGSARSDDALKLYKKIDYLKITPEHPMARVGGGGGPIPKVPAQLEAIAYSVGADGKKGTSDDFRIGAVKANWSLTNLNKAAAEMKDTKYAGHIEQNGLFVPNVAGPNPDRKYKTNNAGELKVTASVKEVTGNLTASVPLVVTVQRFNNPPIH